jgi:hypothetical protein
MMVMPFDWRPSEEKLENPWTNLFWGSRALANIIRDGHGDLFYSLAAYNGSWEKIDRSSTQHYASSVLGYYTAALAVQQGLPASDGWVAVIAAEGPPGPRTITVLGPDIPLARYTERPCGSTDIPQVPEGAAPTATAITFIDESGTECRVNVWLLTEDQNSVVAIEPESKVMISSASDWLPVYASR